MKKVLILSDVHGNLPLAEKVINENKNDVDYILYLGDWGHKDRTILKENNVIAIQGNHPHESEEEIVKFIQIEDVKIMMTHGHYYSSLSEYVSNKKLIKGSEGSSLILHGHTHIKKHDEIDEVIILNPGSLSEPRDDSHGSYITLSIDGEDVQDIEFHKV